MVGLLGSGYTTTPLNLIRKPLHHSVLLLLEVLIAKVHLLLRFRFHYSSESIKILYSTIIALLFPDILKAQAFM